MLQVAPFPAMTCTMFPLMTERAPLHNTTFLHRFHVPFEDFAGDGRCAASAG